VRRLALAGTLWFSSLAVSASTLDDMELRSNVEASIRGTAQTANLHLKIMVENGVAIPEGVVRDLNQADDVWDLASKVKGITGIDRSKLRQEFPNTNDEELAARVSRTLFSEPKLAASSLKVAVENGVVTLTGAIKNAAWRGEIRRLCGGIQGVVEVVDRIGTPETADAKIQKVLESVFGVRVVPRFPGYVKAIAKDGVVTLEGHVPRLYDKQAAEFDARGINGVHSVDNRLELRSATAIRVIHP
jgi:osmotically-inducible protein OsmY